MVNGDQSFVLFTFFSIFAKNNLVLDQNVCLVPIAVENSQVQDSDFMNLFHRECART